MVWRFFFVVFGTLSFFLEALWRKKKTAKGYTLMKKISIYQYNTIMRPAWH